MQANFIITILENKKKERQTREEKLLFKLYKVEKKCSSGVHLKKYIRNMLS